MSRSKTLWVLPILSLLFLGLQQFAGAQTIDLGRVEAVLEEHIEREMLEGRIPSLSIALVDGNRVVWSKAFGDSNLWARTPATPSTVYMIGSTFKPMETVALLGFMEKGRFSLDDRVNDYLEEFKIQGEDPRHPITFRHLLTHSSGIPGQAEEGAFPDAIDEVTKNVIPYWDRPFQAYPIWGYLLPPPMSEYLSQSLKVTRPPLERVEYSPVAFTLVAYLIEKFSGVPFIEHIQKNVFDALGMNSTTFVPRADMDERFAIPYVVDPDTRHHVAVSRVRISIWPTGLVYSTAPDMANWLVLNFNGGAFGGRRLISAKTLDEIHTRQYEQLERMTARGETTGYGLGWNVSDRKGDRYISHGGSLPGESAYVLGNLTRKVGVAILSNGNRASAHLRSIAEKAIDLMIED